jgi:putative flippase GtrA
MTPESEVHQRLFSQRRLPQRRFPQRPFLWYVIAGVATTGIQALLFLLMRVPLGSVAANLLALVVTTVLNSEFHRRVTFAEYRERTFRLHVQSILTFAFYAGYGSLVLIGLNALVDRPSATLETTALLLVSAGGGIARFLILRGWVFTRKRTNALVRESTDIPGD